MDTARLSRFVSGLWDKEIVPQLVDYIRIPNKSPMFDTEWVAHGTWSGGEADGNLGALQAAAAAGRHAGGGAAGRAHAADLHRGAGRRATTR